MIGFHGKNTKNGKITGNMKPITGEHSFNPLSTRLLSFILSISILLTVAAPFAEPQTVEANWVTNTIGGLIASLVLNAGAANIDTNYINYLNDPNNTVMSIEIPNDGGVTTLPSDLAQQIDTAIASAPPSVQRTVSQLATSQADIVYIDEYLKNNGVPEGAPQEMQPATVGENVASAAQNLQQTGYVEPSIGGMANALLMNKLGSVVNDLGQRMKNNYLLGSDIINLVKDGKLTTEQAQTILGMTGTEAAAYYKTIANGADINTPQTAMQYLGNTGSTASGYFNAGNYNKIDYILEDGLVAYSYSGGSQYVIDNPNRTGSYYVTRITHFTNGTTSTNRDSLRPYNNLTVSNSEFTGGIGFMNLNQYSDQNQIRTLFQNETLEMPHSKSPSLVGESGQLTANYNFDPDINLNYYTTNQAPIYNYNNYKMEPINLNEYSNFANSITQQINSGASQESISQAVQEYVYDHLVEFTVPVPTTAPVVPDQPTPDPKPTGTPEQQQENEEIMATPELKDKFPFCIPWDVYYAFAVLEDQREAPALDFDLDLGPAGTHHIEIDFSEWEDIAALLRLLELLAFIIGLAIATKHLMGGTGA